MMTSLEVLVFALIFAAPTFAQSCNMSNPCSLSAPCCSEYGFCGSDQFCLGGCNPMYSNQLSSCRPNPVCQDANYTMYDLSRMINATLYDGNATAHDWTIDQGNLITTPQNELVLTLSQANGGTRLSSTRFIHYGTITARMKAGRWKGVVAAFITMSNIKDEIDWEFPGGNVTQGQSNYFWQGFFPTPSNGKTTDGLTDNYANYHDYTIDWQPKTLTFKVDGKTVRTVNQADTVKDGISYYPNTPARIQLSLWPAGINTSAAGTVDWAGGYIDWNDPDYVSAGHFYMYVSSLSVQCGDSPPAGMTGYVYGANQTTFTPSISFTNASTSLNGALSSVSVPRGVLSVAVIILVSLIGVHVA